MVVVVKIGTSSLTDSQGIIRREAIEKLCLEVAGAPGFPHLVSVEINGLATRKPCRQFPPLGSRD